MFLRDEIIKRGERIEERFGSKLQQDIIPYLFYPRVKSKWDYNFEIKLLDNEGLFLFWGSCTLIAQVGIMIDNIWDLMLVLWGISINDLLMKCMYVVFVCVCVCGVLLLVCRFWFVILVIIFLSVFCWFFRNNFFWNQINQIENGKIIAFFAKWTGDC